MHSIIKSEKDTDNALTAVVEGKKDEILDGINKEAPNVVSSPVVTVDANYGTFFTLTMKDHSSFSFTISMQLPPQK
jgi:hypothetical protein